MNYTQEPEIISNVVHIIRQRQHNIINVTNGGLIKLFWDIGDVLNLHFDKFQVRAKEAEIKKLGTVLGNKYGFWFEFQNLKKMGKFRTVVPDFNEIKSFLPFLSWDYILEWLPLKPEAQPVNFFRHPVQNGFEIEGFRKSLKSKDFEMQGGINKGNGLSLQPESYNIFQSNSLLLLKNILNPKRVKIKKIFDDCDNVILEIQKLIHGFKKDINNWVNQNFILCMWETGKEINLKNGQNNSLKQPSQRIIRNFFQDIPGPVKYLFYENNYKLMSGFATVFPEISGPLKLSKLVEWPYFKTLLSLKDRRMILFYAKKAALEGWTLKQLEAGIKINSFGGVEEFIEELIVEKEERQIKNNRNNITTTIFVDLGNHFAGKTPLRNIFKAPYLGLLLAKI